MKACKARVAGEREEGQGAGGYFCVCVRVCDFVLCGGGGAFVCVYVSLYMMIWVKHMKLAL